MKYSGYFFTFSLSDYENFRCQFSFVSNVYCSLSKYPNQVVLCILPVWVIPGKTYLLFQIQNVKTYMIPRTSPANSSLKQTVKSYCNEFSQLYLKKIVIAITNHITWVR